MPRVENANENEEEVCELFPTSQRLHVTNEQGVKNLVFPDTSLMKKALSPIAVVINL